MIPETFAVGLLRCPEYRRRNLMEKIDQLCRAISMSLRSGDTVLLKPNLIGAQSAGGLACTHPEFIAAAAAWCLDHSVRVVVGDSPAFGSARGVMRAVGIIRALQGMPVRMVNFRRCRRVVLAGGIAVDLAEQVLECDMLINLPKVKAHSQLCVSLAIKNFFGSVVGMRKAWYHLRYGDHPERFAGLLVDLLAVLPAGATLVDGIVAMHENGPLQGRPFQLGVLAGSLNPVALETALMEILGVAYDRNPLWLECARRGLPGTRPADIVYPLNSPAAVKASDFQVPAVLKPISFNPCRMMISAVKRSAALLKG
jgi:uncharacterized protein (DUF362 family)